MRNIPLQRVLVVAQCGQLISVVLGDGVVGLIRWGRDGAPGHIECARHMHTYVVEARHATLQLQCGVQLEN